MEERKHLPVMPEETVWFLTELSPELVVDGTSGAGGHTALLSQALPDSHILAFERDPDAVKNLSEVFRDTNVTVVNASYTNIPEYLSSGGFAKAGAALFDLGLSSVQLDTPERGFSYRLHGPLDMRFNRSRGVPASALLARMSEKQIADMIYRYGEERRSRAIARAIKRYGHIETTDDLAAAVRSVVRGNAVKSLSRVFQALRIQVNRELEHLEKLLAEMHLWTAQGCRIAFITFHSLEDRLIKLHFRDSEYFSQHDPVWRLPSSAERRTNPRARSARLRMGVRL